MQALFVDLPHIVLERAGSLAFSQEGLLFLAETVPLPAGLLVLY